MESFAHAAPSLMPVLFVPHGGGPMPLLDEPNHRDLVSFLRTVVASIATPKAIVLITSHWEEVQASVSSATHPGMFYDYHGFPSESYSFTYPAPGDPSLAQVIVDLLAAQAIPARLDAQRDYDHGTFVPLMLMYPDATIPVVQLSLLSSLDPAAHLALGRAIAPLRAQGVLIVGSGMSFHNMRAFFSSDPTIKGKSDAFDTWLSETLVDKTLTSEQREQRLLQWDAAPSAQFSHPRAEHLMPLLVCAGAALAIENPALAAAEKNFSGAFFNTTISGFIWR